MQVLEHALMRGLRRGIGLYIKEVSSPAYRREVQRLATKVPTAPRPIILSLLYPAIQPTTQPAI